jgi:uncharacterized protein (TIGR02996 family)
MPTDAEFQAGLLADPTDDATRLVYADWLDEQGDSVATAKAEFLRLTAQLLAPTLRSGRRKKLRKRLQELARGLDTDWLAVVSRLAVENCEQKRRDDQPRPRRPGPVSGIEFGYLCDRRWEGLQPTDERGVRFCAGCGQNVHFCDTITEARRHAWDGHCIAVDLGVIRRPADLEREAVFVGRPGPQLLRREWERMQPDEVSAERERRKQEQAGGEAAT